MNIAQVMIFVEDLEVSKPFYVETVGLEIEHDLSNEMNMLIMRNDSCIFTIHGGHPKSDLSEFAKITLCFGVNDLDFEVERLKSLGVSLIGDIIETPVHRYQAFLDPDNNLIEIGQYN